MEALNAAPASGRKGVGGEGAAVHIRQSRPDYGGGFLVKELQTLEVVGSWLRRGWEGRPVENSSSSEAGSCLRLIYSCVTHFRAQGASRTCNERGNTMNGFKSFKDPLRPVTRVTV